MIAFLLLYLALVVLIGSSIRVGMGEDQDANP